MSWGADPFVSKKGKYAPVEIDDDVEVDGKPRASGDTTRYARRPRCTPRTRGARRGPVFSEDARERGAVELSHIDPRKPPPPGRCPRSGRSPTGGSTSLTGRSSSSRRRGTRTSRRVVRGPLSSRFRAAIPRPFGADPPSPVIDASSSPPGTLRDMRNGPARHALDGRKRRARSRAERARPRRRSGAPCPADPRYESLPGRTRPRSTRTPRECRMIREHFDPAKSSRYRSILLGAFSANRHWETGRVREVFRYRQLPPPMARYERRRGGPHPDKRREHHAPLGWGGPGSTRRGCGRRVRGPRAGTGPDSRARSRERPPPGGGSIPCDVGTVPAPPSRVFFGARGRSSTATTCFFLAGVSFS